MTEPFTRAFTAAVDDVDTARAWVVSRINTDAVDRYQTVLDPLGMDRADYLKNPVVLWEHGKDPARGKVPVGRNAWLKARGRGEVLAKTFFASDEFSRGLFELYRDGFLSGWSVNGMPRAAGPPTAAELRSRPELRECKTVYRSWSLTEYSAVAVPGNGECLTEDVSRSLRAALDRGLWVPDLVRDMLPPLAPNRVADVPGLGLTPVLPPLVVYRTLDGAAESVTRRARELALAELATALADARDLARGRV